MMHEYKGFSIKEIYQSADGRGNLDYFVSGPDFVQSAVKMKTTLSKVKLYIDTQLLNIINK
jgi:hypothetical protein